MKSKIEPFLPRDRLLLVSIARSIEKTKSVYDSARFAWRVDIDRARDIDLVLACVGGIVEGVFVPLRWMEATRKNFPDLVATHRGLRWGFEGAKAGQAIESNYLGKRVPDGLAIGQGGIRYHDGLGRDLAKILRKTDLPVEEFKAWNRDLRAARKILKPPKNRWR